MSTADPTTSFEMNLQFSRHPANVGRARNELRRRLLSRGVAEDSVEAAALLLSELMGNAIRHAHAPVGREIGVHVRAAAGLLRVEVADAGDRLPRARDAGPDDETGRGLALVAAVSSRHGVCPRPHGIGKTVWAEVPLTLRGTASTD